MKRIIAALMATAATCIAAGCNSQPQAPIKPTQSQVTESINATRQKIQQVQNDPSIPEGMKPQIVARLQSNIDRTIQANQAAPAGR